MVEIQHLVSSQIQSIRTKIFCIVSTCLLTNYGSSHPEVFLRKGVLKIGNKFTGEHPCRSAISMKLLSNFIEIPLWHRCSPVNLPHIFRTPFSKNTFRGLLLKLKYLWLEDLSIAGLESVISKN